MSAIFLKKKKLSLISLSSRGSLLAVVNGLFCSGRLEQSKKLVRDDVNFKFMCLFYHI